MATLPGGAFDDGGLDGAHFDALTDALGLDANDFLAATTSTTLNGSQGHAYLTGSGTCR